MAIVTGASRGLGRAIAERLAAAGASVAISARTMDPDPRYEGSLTETAAAIRAAGGEALPVACDLSDRASRHALVDVVRADLGPIDILVNNAAVTFLWAYDSFTEKRFKLMVEVQLWAPYELGQLVVPDMRERGEGWILNLTSRAGEHPTGPPYEAVHAGGGLSVYGTVKAGLDRMTTALAAELHASNIAVNALAPPRPPSPAGRIGVTAPKPPAAGQGRNVVGQRPPVNDAGPPGRLRHGLGRYLTRSLPKLARFTIRLRPIGVMSYPVGG